ncbi:MAG: glycosyltransferase family 9 protein [Nitrospirae bacterium]|nr:glycosyltransferase family 9 protein [Nitrospirota bacterium]
MIPPPLSGISDLKSQISNCTEGGGATQKEVLALRGGALGDFVLSIPHFLALQDHFGRLTIATHAKYVPFLRALGLGEKILPLDRSDTTRLLYADPPQIYDGLISWLKRGTKHPTVLGRRFEVYVSSAEATNGHVADAYWECLKPLGILPLPPLELRSRFQMGMGKVFSTSVVLHPGSGGDWKRWPLSYYLELARRFAEEHAADRVLVLIGPEDESWAGDLRGLRLPDGVSLVESDDIMRTAGMLASASLFVGNDSGVTHLSALLGVPTIAIHGPTSPIVWGARGRAVNHVWDPTGCACKGEDVRRCVDSKCLRHIPPSAVLQAGMMLANAPPGC